MVCYCKCRLAVKGNSGIYLLKPSLQTNVNISKSLFNNKMSISLMINDIFKTDKVQWGIDHSNIVFDYDKYTDSCYVQLTIRYNFNAAKVNIKETLQVTKDNDCKLY